MQSDQKCYPRKAAPPLSFEVGDCTYNIPVPSVLDATVMSATHAVPVHGMNTMSPNCPKNFIIFDQTDNKCTIMFYPPPANMLYPPPANMFYPPPANIFNCPSFDIHTSFGEENDRNKDDDKESSFKEDTKDIDALLSLEDEEDEDEEVSTGRTMGNCGSISPDSCSTNGSKSCKTRSSSFQRSFSCSSSERKQQKIRKMLKALRGIVPSGDQMDTATVLDEAIRYLKSLKVEVKKLGIKNFKKN